MKSGTSARTAGLLIAAAVALVTAGVVIVVAVSSNSGSGDGTSTPPFPIDEQANGEGTTPPDEVVDVGDVTESLQNGQRGSAELYDKNDRSRIAAHLEWERFEPQPGGWIDLIQPRVWLYMKDGRTVYVRSEQATLKTPSLQQAPESGVLREAVVIKLFTPVEAHENGAGEMGGVRGAIDPNTDVPGLMAVTDTLSFDMLLSELSTPDHVRVETTNVKAEWTGLTARFNQTRQTLEYARLDSKGDVWVYPKAEDEGDDEEVDGEDEIIATDDAEIASIPAAETYAEMTTIPQPHDASASAAEQYAIATASEPEKPREKKRRKRKKDREAELAASKAPEQIYQAVFVDDVRVERGSVTLDADVMRVLMRTIDGKLPEHAFGKVLKEDRKITPRRIERRSANREQVVTERPRSMVEKPVRAFALYEPAAVDVLELITVDRPMNSVDLVLPVDIAMSTGGTPAPRKTDAQETKEQTSEARAGSFRLYQPIESDSIITSWTFGGSAFSSLTSLSPTPTDGTAVATDSDELADAESAEPRVNDPDLPIHLTWSGVLEVLAIPEEKTPEDLKVNAGGVAHGQVNHLSVRWIAEGQRPVIVYERATGGWAECDTLDYHATTRTLSLISGSDDRDTMRAWVEWPGTARGTFDRLSINLGSGVGHAEGAGELATTGTRASANRDIALDERDIALDERGVVSTAERESAKSAKMGKRVTWTHGADFSLRTRRGWVGDGIEWAEFAGKVLARDERSSISGEKVRVDFEHDGVPRSPSRLAKLTVKGDAVALADMESTQTNSGDMRADYLEVEFETIAGEDPRGGDTSPTYVWAEGNVSTSKDGDVVRGHQLEAELTRESNRDRVTVSRAEVRGSDDGRVAARIERADGSQVTAQRVVAHAAKNTADIFGLPAVLEKDGSKIFGDEISLRGEADKNNGQGAELFVFGAGRFEMTRPGVYGPPAEDEELSPARSAIATWTKSMSYDDSTGRLDCSGNAEVESWDGELAVDRMKAERVFVNVSTASNGDDERRVVRVEAIGSILEEDNGVNAHVESRRYVLNDATSTTSGEDNESSKRLVQLFYLEGPRIVADDVAGTVSVPAAGRAVIVDKRDEAELDRLASSDARGSTSSVKPATTHTRTPTDGPSGTSRFVWAGSALFTRSTGVLDLKDEVELINKPTGDDQAMRLTCSRLLATIVDAKTGIGGTLASGTNPGSSDKYAASLRSVEATGSIYTQQGGTSLTADRLFYDAPTDVITAEATGNNRVSMNDPKQATPIVAKRLYWNLRTDRIEIVGPEGVNTPR